MNKLKPNFTQIPNIVFDEWLNKLGYAELKVVLYIMRRTYGFHKRSDNISISQIQHGIKDLDFGTGLGREAVMNAVKSLEEKKVLIVSREKSVNNYSLNFDRYESSITELVRLPNQPSSITEPKLVRLPNTQKKGNKVNKIKKAKDKLSPFVFSDYIKNMEESSDRRMEVIAFYFKEKKITYDTEEKIKTSIKRHLRPATEVANFSDEEIVKATEKVKKEFPEYTIETILKQLTR